MFHGTFSYFCCRVRYVAGAGRQPQWHRAQVVIGHITRPATEAGQPEERSDAAVPLRPGDQPDVPGDGTPLRRGGDPGALRQAPGQGEGRAGRADDPALGPGALAPRALHPRGAAQRGDGAAAPGRQRPAAAGARDLAPGALRAGRADGAPGSAEGAVRGRRLAAPQGRPGLPHRGRAPLLQRALHPGRPSSSRCA